jgi:predicted HicB family RNase H-like nuclease
MSDLFEYKGYSGTIEYSDADEVLFGKVLGISGLISYEGDSLRNLRKDFEGAVDDYLEMCADNNEEPQKPYRGTFNVRVSPELHRSLAIYAVSHGQSLNSTVEEAIKHHVMG